ncbi:MAG: LysR substrate-binding domain-containing protein, partial [Dongiaceae bacterium]
MRIAVPRDSDDQAIMAAAAHEFAEERPAIRLKLIVVESLADASHALQEGHADLAIVRSDLAMPPNGQTVLIMRRDAAVLFAPAESS